MARYSVVKKGKGGSFIGVGTLRTRAGKPVSLVLRVPVSGEFSLVAELDDDEPTVPNARRPRSGGWTVSDRR